MQKRIYWIYHFHHSFGYILGYLRKMRALRVSSGGPSRVLRTLHCSLFMVRRPTRLYMFLMMMLTTVDSEFHFIRLDNCSPTYTVYVLVDEQINYCFKRMVW